MSINIIYNLTRLMKKYNIPEKITAFENKCLTCNLQFTIIYVNSRSHFFSEEVMAKDTKERILESALDIFAQDGFAGTNIKDIADSVGIVKSALYRHFASKEEIWNAVYEMMHTYYIEHFGSVEALPKIPESTAELYETTMRMVDFTVHDKKVRQMRKIIVTEQFRHEKIRDLASNYFLYDTHDIFEKLFAGMMENGSIRKDDPGILAFAYTAPVTALIHLCDREPEKEEEAFETLDKFLKHFINEYGVK